MKAVGGGHKMAINAHHIRMNHSGQQFRLPGRSRAGNFQYNLAVRKVHLNRQKNPPAAALPQDLDQPELANFIANGWHPLGD